MAHIFQDGDVSVHIQPALEPTARCYDLRDESFRTVVDIDLVAFLPVGYGEEQEDSRIPSWQFVVRAITVCATRGDELWDAWRFVKNDLT